MIKRITLLGSLLLLLTAAANAQQHQTQPPSPPAKPQSTTQPDATRDATREKLRAVLIAYGPKVNVEFRQSPQQAYIFSGVMTQGLVNAQSFETVITVGSQQTIHFRIYPHYAGGYINIDKVRNPSYLMRLLLRYSDKNFLYWGADESGDIFAGYNFTLESGFPEASIRVVLNSISNLDQFVGEMKQAIDSSASE